MTLRAAWVPFVESRKVASVRLRTYNPVKILQAKGHDVRVLAGGLPSPDEVLVLQKAYADQHLEMARRHRQAGGAAVLDLCDNHFVTDGDPVLAARATRLTRLLDNVDVVSVCTDQLGEAVPHPSVATVNDALDPVHPDGWSSRWARSLHSKQRVVWFGTAGAHDLPFGMRDLQRVLPALGRIAKERPFELLIMSNSRKAFAQLVRPPELSVRYVPWSARRFTLAAAVSDVAILPVEINDVTRGKSSNRVATALQHRLCVVTDPLPSYLAFAECVRLGDYERHVTEYLESASLRAADVATGQRIVKRLYAPEVIADEWTQVLQGASLRARQR